MKIKFFSIVNGQDKEYWPIKDNFMMHLERIGLKDKHELIITDTSSGNWEEEGFLDTVYHKLDMTRYYLKNGYYVFCSDLDIVFLRDPINNLKKTMVDNKYDILFQHDYGDYGDEGIYSCYCTGFYFVKPSKMTKNLFDRNVNIFKRKNKIDLPMGDRSDQKYINRKLTQKRFKPLNVGLLDKEIYPNGWVWMNQKNKNVPYIVHYNCIEGGIKAKEIEMQRFNHWLV